MSFLDIVVEDIKEFNPPFSDEEKYYLKLNFIWDLVLAATDLCVLIVLLYLSYTVFKLTNCGNPKINLLFIFMNLTLISDLVLRLMLIKDNLERREIRKNNNFYVKDKIKFAILMQCPKLFLQMTILTNLNNWIFYLIKIQETADKNASNYDTDDENVDYISRGSWINFFTVTFGVGMVIVNTMYIYDVMYNDYENAREFEIMANGFIFAILGLTFLIIGIVITRLLVNNFRIFYSKYKCALYNATFALSLPIILRGVSDIVRGFLHYGYETYI